jgi:excisionase family DNA binding protein
VFDDVSLSEQALAPNSDTKEWGLSTPDKISVSEACAYLECGHPKLMELLHDRQIPGLKFGKAWVIPRAAFITVVNRMAMAACNQDPSERPTADAGDAVKPSARKTRAIPKERTQ